MVSADEAYRQWKNSLMGIANTAPLPQILDPIVIEEPLIDEPKKLPAAKKKAKTKTRRKTK